MARVRITLLAGFAATLLVAVPGHAEDVDSILEVLEENVVTGASRSAERASEARRRAAP